MGVLTVLRGLAQKLGPYLLIELLLPGGSLVALALFLYERKKLGSGRPISWSWFDLRRALMRWINSYRLGLEPCYLQPQAVKSIRRER
ncbi:MAG TPA: hypothetical protein VKG21_01060 [Casimicrobiaceae bacterium]|nr:hypothetical protein [Casimicrobiaceae bacterium]